MTKRRILTAFSPQTFKNLASLHIECSIGNCIYDHSLIPEFCPIVFILLKEDTNGNSTVEQHTKLSTLIKSTLILLMCLILYMKIQFVYHNFLRGY